LSDLSVPALTDALKNGLTALGVGPGRQLCDSYLRYLEELQRWNRAYNLTAIRQPEQMLTHHIFDSLSILPYIKGDCCLDVGTGAGLPGFILALASPETKWVLLDSQIKKIRFLQHIVRELKPANVEVVHARVEDYSPGRRFTTIVTRALTTLANFRRITAHLREKDCILLAMKGADPQAELAGLPAARVSVHRLDVPGLASERHLVIIRE
jgi:16S rRNA (guanine527-N7)-methyltransferase